MAISGSPVASSSSQVQVANRVDASRCCGSVRDALRAWRDPESDRRRSGTARPDRRSAGSRSPTSAAPPRGPRGPDCSTTNPGRSLRLAADAVGDPGAHAGPAEPRRAGVHEALGRAVIEVVGGDAVQISVMSSDDAGDVRQQVRDPGARSCRAA